MGYTAYDNYLTNLRRKSPVTDGAAVSSFPSAVICSPLICNACMQTPRKSQAGDMAHYICHVTWEILRDLCTSYWLSRLVASIVLKEDIWDGVYSLHGARDILHTVPILARSKENAFGTAPSLWLNKASSEWLSSIFWPFIIWFGPYLPIRKMTVPERM